MIEVAKENTGKRMANLQKRLTQEAGKTVLAAVMQARTKYEATLNEAVELATKDQLTQAKTAVQLVSGPAQQDYVDALDELFWFQDKVVTENALATQIAATDLQRVIWIVIAVALAVGILMSSQRYAVKPGPSCRLRASGLRERSHRLFRDRSR